MSKQAINGDVQTSTEGNAQTTSKGMDRFLNFIERTGNKVPDPALLFFWGLLLVWGLSALFSQFSFGLVHPITQASVEAIALARSGFHKSWKIAGSALALDTPTTASCKERR